MRQQLISCPNPSCGLAVAPNKLRANDRDRVYCPGCGADVTDAPKTWIDVELGDAGRLIPLTRLTTAEVT